MKRSVIWLLVALLTFTICLGATVAWLYAPHPPDSRVQQSTPTEKSTALSAEPDVPVIAFCDLVRNPDLYDHKIVRTKAILSVGRDTRTLWDSACNDLDVSGECFHPPDKTCERISAAIDQFRGGEKGAWINDSTAVDVIGEFYAHGENGGGYELEMLEIKDAKAVKARRR